MKIICLLILLALPVCAQDSLWGVPIDTVKESKDYWPLRAMFPPLDYVLPDINEPYPHIIPEPDWKLECLRLQFIIDSLKNELNIKGEIK